MRHGELRRGCGGAAAYLCVRWERGARRARKCNTQWNSATAAPPAPSAHQPRTTPLPPVPAGGTSSSCSSSSSPSSSTPLSFPRGGGELHTHALRGLRWRITHKYPSTARRRCLSFSSADFNCTLSNTRRAIRECVCIGEKANGASRGTH